MFKEKARKKIKKRAVLSLSKAKALVVGYGTFFTHEFAKNMPNPAEVTQALILIEARDDKIEKFDINYLALL